MKLVYYDPLCGGQYQTRALGTLGAYVDQVSHAQEVEVTIDAATIERELHNTPKQPDVAPPVNLTRNYDPAKNEICLKLELKYITTYTFFFSPYLERVACN